MFRARWVVQPQVAGYPPFAAKAATAGGQVIRLQVTGCRFSGFQDVSADWKSAIRQSEALRYEGWRGAMEVQEFF